MADGVFNSPFGTKSNLMIGEPAEQILPQYKILNANNPEPADCHD